MHPSITNLFEYTRNRITEQDIIDFSPDDLGYNDHVRVWTDFWKTGQFPHDAPFEITETIALTNEYDPVSSDLSDRYQHYRRFTHAVGIMTIHEEPGWGLDYSSLCYKLLKDADRSSQLHIQLLRTTLPPTRELLIDEQESCVPLFTLASMLLAQYDSDFQSADLDATQLIDDGSKTDETYIRVHKWSGNRFLFGVALSKIDLKRWTQLAATLNNPNNHEDTQFVIDTLMNTTE